MACAALGGLFLTACQTGSQLPGAPVSAAADACANIKPGSGPYTPPFPETCGEVQSSADGLRWIEMVAGPEGKASPQDGATVIVGYEGYLASNGTRIDSSYARGEPAVFNIEAVIEGWTRTLKRMTPGDEWLVYIPAGLAYRDGSPGPDIPPNSDLVFKIRLDGFLNPDEMAGGAADATPDRGVSEAFWAEFLPWDAGRDGVVKLKSGLSYLELEAGEPRAGKIFAKDTVVIDYEARLADTGDVVGSTFSAETPLTVQAGDMVPGVAQMISLMKPGAVWIGRIPSAIGYGKEGLGDAIPPGANLIYLVNLIDVNPD